MANDLAYRFTEEKYCTKSDVMKELHTSLVDNIWNNILKYRQDYFFPTGLKCIDSSSLLLCKTNSLFNGLIKNLEDKLTDLMNEFGAIQDNADYSLFESAAFVNSIKGIAKSHGSSFDESRLVSITKNQIMSIDQDGQMLSRYIEALKFIQANYLKPINSEFMLSLHRIISYSDVGYRSRNDTNPENRVLIDRIYTSAPMSVLGTLLRDLFAFIEKGEFGSVVTSAIVYYYINVIKPFDKYNNEVAYLMAKAILAHENMGSLSVYLPLEMLEFEDNVEQAKLYNDTQKYTDVTYFVNYLVKYFGSYVDGLMDIIINYKTREIKEEQYLIEPEPIEVNESIKEETLTVEPIKVEENKVEDVKPEPIKPVKRETKIEKPIVRETQPTNELAVGYIPPAIDEKEMARLETHLLELDPELRKREAHFYARHCTLGKKYTIQEFKKCNNCVYETARTGMDHLAELGYYEKQPVKNKFVYTPILRK